MSSKLDGLMYTFDLPPEKHYDQYGTIDIETDGFDGAQNQLAAVGVGVFDTGESQPEIEVFTRGDANGDEIEIVREAFSWLNARSIEAVVTYNGTKFDFSFIHDRLEALGVEDKPSIATGNHIDLFPPRKRAAERDNEKWPSLEESLAAYDLDTYETVWNEQRLTNSLFGERFAPDYFSAIERGAMEEIEEYERTLFEYTASDIEATIALYEAEVNRPYQPTYQF